MVEKNDLVIITHDNWPRDFLMGLYRFLADPEKVHDAYDVLIRGDLNRGQIVGTLENMGLIERVPVALLWLGRVYNKAWELDGAEEW